MKQPETIQAPILMVRRAEALQVYATVEYSLAMAIHVLMKCDAKFALTMIQRISNTRARYMLIADLIEQSDLKPIKSFWSGLERRLNRLDSIRNNIVHWNYVTSEKDGEATHLLTSWKTMHGGKSKPMGIGDVEDFMRDAGETASLINLYFSYLMSDRRTRAALHDIYLQPITHQTLEALMQKVHSLAGQPARP